MTIMNIDSTTTNNEYDGSYGDEYDVIDDDQILVMTITMMEYGEQ